LIAGLDKTPGSVKPVGYARVEWVLKWLLDKLLSDDLHIGPWVRSRAAVWDMLSRLVAAIPPSNAARLLNSGRLLDSLQKTLEEQLATKPTQNGDDSQNAVSKSSKKRKRGTDGSPSSQAPKETQVELFDNIYAFVQGILLAADVDSGRGDAISKQHLRSVLRVDASSAAALLGLWCSITTHVLVEHRQFLGASLQPFLKIWDSRSIKLATDDATSSHVFSAHCLRSIVLLHGQLSTSSAILGTDHEPERLGMIYDLESLLIRHLIIPARAIFMTAKKQKDVSSSYVMLAVASLFKPLQELSAVMIKDQDFSQFQCILTAIPNLYGLAIRTCSRSTPKQKAIEDPWLETFLEVLALCGSEPVSGDLDGTDDSQLLPPGSALEEMLVQCKNHKITLSAAFLDNIVNRRTGLLVPLKEQRDDKNPVAQWSLIGRILELDGEVFVRSGAVTSTIRNSATAALVNYISAMRWNTSASKSAQASEYARDRSKFVGDILVPLLNSFLRLREFPGFLILWFTELTKHAHLIGAPDQGDIAWTSDKLVDAVSAALNTNVTTSQVIEILQPYMLPIQKVSSGKIDSDAMAGLIVVDAIVAGIQNEDTINKSKPQLLQLGGLVQQNLTSLAPENPVALRLWRLLTRLWHIQEQSEDYSGIFSKGRLILESGLLQCAQRSIHNSITNGSDSGFQGFDFILELCSTMSQDEESKAQSAEILNQAYQPFIQKFRKIPIDKDLIHYDSHLHFMSTIVAAVIRLPQTLLSLDSDDRVDLFHALHILASSSPQQEGHRQAQSKFSHIELALQQSILALGHSQIRDDWLSSFSQILESGNSTTLIDTNPELAVHLLLHFPIETIPREMRERLLNSLTKSMLNQPSSLVQSLFLIVRLCRSVSPAATLVSKRHMCRTQPDWF
jgi:hypothetical protein